MGPPETEEAAGDMYTFRDREITKRLR
jgi:hypothetical protein